MPSEMKRIETVGMISNVRQRTFYLKNATVEELLVFNLKPEVRTAEEPVCEMLTTRSFRLAESDTKLFAQKARQLVSGKPGAKWKINQWQIQITYVDTTGITENEDGEDILNMPDSWMDIITAFSANLQTLDVIFEVKGFEQNLQISDDKLQIVLPVLKMSQKCTKLKSLRIQSDIRKSNTTDTWATVIIDPPTYEKLERLTIPMKEIILKGIGCNVALELAQYAGENLEKFYWQSTNCLVVKSSLQYLMEYLCKHPDIKELDIFATNLKVTRNEIFHASPNTMENMEKVKVYMFTIDPKAIQSLSTVIMTKVRSIIVSNVFHVS